MARLTITGFANYGEAMAYAKAIEHVNDDDLYVNEVHHTSVVLEDQDANEEYTWNYLSGIPDFPPLPNSRTVLGRYLKPGMVVADWENSRIDSIVVHPDPSVIVTAQTTGGPYGCGKEALMTICGGGKQSRQKVGLPDWAVL